MKVAVVVGSYSPIEENWIKNILNTLNKSIDDLTLLDFNKSNKVEKLFEDECKVKKLDVSSLNSWKEIIKKYENVLEEFDAIFLVRFVIITGLKKGKDNQVYNWIKKHKENDNYSMNYVSMKTIYSRLALVSVAGELNKRVFHIVIDPQELSYDNYFKFKEYRRIFQLKRDDAIYGPYYEYCLCKYNKVSSEDKEKLLFFIGTALSEDRNFLYDLYEDFKGHEGIYFGLYDGKKFKERVPQRQYFEELKKAKYTVIIKAYDATSFSMTRFMEAIVLDCIPLILDDVCLDELKNTFEDMYKLALKLVVSKEELCNRVSTNFDNDHKILEEIKACKSYKKITTLEKVKAYYKKLLEDKNG